MWNKEFIDSINVLDFLISLQNLRENDEQTDKQELEEHFNSQLNNALGEIQSHLESQDKKIDTILSRLEALL